MKIRPLVFALLAIPSAVLFACGGGEEAPFAPPVTDSPAASQTSPPVTTPVPSPTIESSETPGRTTCAEIRGTQYRNSTERAFYLAGCVDRTNCNQIEGTQYRSLVEQSWYLANCLGSESPGPAGPAISSTVVTSEADPQPASCRAADVASSAARFSVGKTVTICGVVSGASYQGSVNGRPTFINFDLPFPNQTFTALIWGDRRGNFSPPPEQQFSAGKCVRVTGLVESYQGNPEIIVTSPSQISLC